MHLAEVVATSERVGSTSSRSAKRDEIAGLLAQLAPGEVAVAVGFLIGAARQGRIGVGWATLRNLAVDARPERSLEILDVDRVLEQLAATSGSGSTAARAGLLRDLFARATEAEQWFLRRLLIGELRQGALEGVMLDAIAKAAGVPATAVRRAFMLSGDIGATATVALTDGRPGLEATGLSVLRGIQPMLASTAASIDDAVAAGNGELVSVEWKLDGARIQVHRDGDDVRVFTRNLNDVTSRLPEVVHVVRSLPASRLVLDGEVLGFLDDGDLQPKAFQDTMSRFGRDMIDAGTVPPGLLRPFFFDVLHVDGHDFVDDPLGDRLTALDELAHGHRIPGIITADPTEAQAFLDVALETGHEGVMVKDLASPYAAGRRGKSWRKVKPVRLLDLVVIGVEWGSGRREGWLSNLHLGARDPETGSFVMVGKTFKGLTDELLAWQTGELLARQIAPDERTDVVDYDERRPGVVFVKPELVAEIALDGVQVSRRYPGGVAMRFARVRRYRPDKTPLDADTIDTVRSLLP